MNLSKEQIEILVSINNGMDVFLTNGPRYECYSGKIILNRIAIIGLHEMNLIYLSGGLIKQYLITYKGKKMLNKLSEK
jgi:hypothetical protein